MALALFSVCTWKRVSPYIVYRVIAQGCVWWGLWVEELQERMLSYNPNTDLQLVERPPSVERIHRVSTAIGEAFPPPIRGRDLGGIRV